VEKFRPFTRSPSSKSPSSANGRKLATDLFSSSHVSNEDVDSQLLDGPSANHYGTHYVRSLNSSEVFTGNDAILKCDFDRTNSLYEVTAWLRDDGKIYLPLDQLLDSIKRTLGPNSVSDTSYGECV